MEAAYVTLEEAATLEGVGYDTMQKKVKRKPENFAVKKARSKSGGKDIVLVSINSLSKLAQAAFKRREELESLANDTFATEEQDTSAEVEKPWYVEADYEWYMRQYQKRYYEGVELGNVVREYLKEARLHKGDLTEYTDRYALERLGKSGRTFRRMVDSYLEAQAWADKLEKDNGCGYDHLMVLALCRKPKDVGLFPSVKPEVKQCIKNIWFNKDFAANNRTKEDLYETLQEVAEAQGWEKLPSYQTVVRYISYLMDQEGLASAHAYARKGIVAWKNQNMVKRCRDTKSLKVLEMVQGDEHTFDFWVMYKLPNGKEIPIRPKLVCWIDTRSRMILGDIICRDANAQILKESLLKLLYEDTGGLAPRYLYIDNGKDYTSQEMIGVQRKDRHNQEAREKHFQMAFDSAGRGFYRDMGIEDEHISMPYEPWTKGQIERSFGTAVQKFSKKFASYTGTLTGSRTDAKIDKDIKEMAKRGELLTMEDLLVEWKKWKEKYNHRVHRGLKKMKEEYVRPAELFERGERYQKAAPPRSYAVMCLMKSETALVKNVGIERRGYYYMADELCKYIGKKLTIKIDPHDVSSIYVKGPDGKLLCQAFSQELLKFGQVEDTVLQEHRKRQNRQLREVRQALEEATTPFDGETAKGYKATVGGIDLTIGKPPERKTKVVQMPADRDYVHNSRKMKQEASEYMTAQARKALEKMKALQEG